MVTAPSACGYSPYWPATCGCRRRRRPCCPTALQPYCPTPPVAGAPAGPAPTRVPNPSPDPNPHPHPNPNPNPSQAPPQALLLLEYLPGGDLGLLLERQGPLGPQATTYVYTASYLEAATLLAQAATSRA